MAHDTNLRVKKAKITQSYEMLWDWWKVLRDWKFHDVEHVWIYYL